MNAADQNPVYQRYAAPRKRLSVLGVAKIISIVVLIFGALVLFLYAISGFAPFVKSIPLENLGTLHVQKGWICEQTTYFVNEKTLSQGVSLYPPEGYRRIFISTSSQRFSTLPVNSKRQSYQSIVKKEGHTFDVAVWALTGSGGPLGLPVYAVVLESTLASGKVVTISYENDPVVTKMVERKDSVEQITDYVFKHLDLSLKPESRL